jgi:hypothetical protein
LRCLISLTVTFGLYAGLESLYRRAGPWWGVAGLLLNLPFAYLLLRRQALGLLAASMATLAIVLWARWRWRTSQAKLAFWRGRRDAELQMELDAMRERTGR